MDYVPWILVQARLTATRTNSRLYAQQLSYGVDLLKDRAHHFPSAAEYIYDDFDALLGRSEQAAEGLQRGLSPIAARIGADLR